MEYNEDFEFLKEYLSTDKYRILNPPKIHDIIESYNIIKTIIDTNHPETNIEIKPGALDLGSISIHIITHQITVYNTTEFVTALKTADIVDIYPTNDDRIHFDLQFENAYYITVL